MINNFDKQKAFKNYFSHNNLDVIMIEYEISRHKFKLMRQKKTS